VVLLRGSAAERREARRREPRGDRRARRRRRRAGLRRLRRRRRLRPRPGGRRVRAAGARRPAGTARRSVQVRSAPGEGTTVSGWVPAAARQEVPV
jgi:hypothetical protein